MNSADRRNPLQTYIPLAVTILIAAGASYVATRVHVAELSVKLDRIEAREDKRLRLLIEHTREIARLTALQDCQDD